MCRIPTSVHHLASLTCTVNGLRPLIATDSTDRYLYLVHFDDCNASLSSSHHNKAKLITSETEIKFGLRTFAHTRTSPQIP